MKKLFVICPTISRSLRIREFLKSFKETKSEGTELILGLDINDPQHGAYIKLSEEYDFHVGDFQGENITQIFNMIVQKEMDWDYYMPINDDFVFKTIGWDKLLIEAIRGKGIAYPNDLFQGENCPTTSVISKEIVQALGWLQLPTLTHLFGDRVWWTIGKTCHCLTYCPDVIIEHRHFVSGKANPDIVSDRTNSLDMYKKDEEQFVAWLTNQAKEDCDKVMKICQNVNV